MAALFKKALVDLSQGYLRPTTVSDTSVYDCCVLYWLPIDERMWSGEVQFKFIENWSEDVELDFSGVDDKHTIKTPRTRPAKRLTNRRRSPTTRSTSSTKIRSKPEENWEDDFFPDFYVQSFLFKESWEGDFFPESFILSFYFVKESWEGELLF